MIQYFPSTPSSLLSCTLPFSSPAPVQSSTSLTDLDQKNLGQLMTCMCPQPSSCKPSRVGLRGGGRQGTYGMYPRSSIHSLLKEVIIQEPSLTLSSKELPSLVFLHSSANLVRYNKRHRFRVLWEFFWPHNFFVRNFSKTIENVWWNTHKTCHPNHC